MSKLAIIAGSGSLPSTLIKSCLKDQREFCVLACHGQSDQSLTLDSLSHQWFGLGELKKMLAYLLEQDVSDLVLAGKFRHITN